MTQWRPKAADLLACSRLMREVPLWRLRLVLRSAFGLYLICLKNTIRPQMPIRKRLRIVAEGVW
jgi:hypothetical protein